MTSDKPNVKAESRYSISKTCELLGIHRNTLRRWTDEGKIKCKYRSSTMRKFYTGYEITKIWERTC